MMPNPTKRTAPMLCVGTSPGKTPKARIAAPMEHRVQKIAFVIPNTYQISMNKET